MENNNADSNKNFQLIVKNFTRDSIYRAFDVAYGELIFDDDETLAMVEGGNIDIDWGSEYFISLNQAEKSNDLVIWGSPGYDAQTEFDEFWILFNENDKSEALEILNKFKVFFEENYPSTRKKFNQLLNKFLLKLGEG